MTFARFRTVSAAEFRMQTQKTYSVPVAARSFVGATGSFRCRSMPVVAKRASVTGDMPVTWISDTLSSSNPLDKPPFV
jgi:hypothetical protein